MSKLCCGLVKASEDDTAFDKESNEPLPVPTEEPVKPTTMTTEPRTENTTTTATPDKAPEVTEPEPEPAPTATETETTPAPVEEEATPAVEDIVLDGATAVVEEGDVDASEVAVETTEDVKTDAVEESSKTAASLESGIKVIKKSSSKGVNAERVVYYDLPTQTIAWHAPSAGRHRRTKSFFGKALNFKITEMKSLTKGEDMTTKVFTESETPKALRMVFPARSVDLILPTVEARDEFITLIEEAKAAAEAKSAETETS